MNIEEIRARSRGLIGAGRAPEAALLLREALRTSPESVELSIELGSLLLRLDDPIEAARSLEPGYRAHSGDRRVAGLYADALLASGLADDAWNVCEETARRNPGDPAALLAAALVSGYAIRGDPALAARHLSARGRLLAAEDATSFPNSRDPDRRLRVGLLTQDLGKDSAIARFASAILLYLDRKNFEVRGYAAQGMAGMTPRLRAAAEWSDVSGLDDDALASRLRSDGLDILVETIGNTWGSRSATLAKRAAPVQVTCIGDPRTTGIPAVDYRIVDEITDPPGSDALCTERLVRLPGCFLCYEPHEDAPASRRPIDARGAGITFGSFNVVEKTGPEVVRVWARILREVQGSRLVLRARGLGAPSVRAAMLARFADAGVEPARIDAGGFLPSMREHLAQYQRVDIALDPFPYCGTTTSCDALWMGVPFVTMLGSWHGARVGASLLTAVGLESLIARDADDYVRLARELAADRARLAEIHRTLRARFSRSPLGRAGDYGKKVGAAYREMWRRWAAASP